MPDGDKYGAPPLAAAAHPPEVLLVCPECGVPQAARAYEVHLRQAHRLIFFRGGRRPYNDTLALLLNLLAATPPDPEAWQALSALMREENGLRADMVLAALVGALLTRIDADHRGATVDGLADLLTREADARLTAALASDGEVAARQLALAIMARQPPPFDAALLQPLRALLLDRRLPVEAQFAALAALLRSAGPNSPLADELLRKLIDGLGKGRSVARLHKFKRRFGNSPAIDALRDELEARIRMTCPRCPAQMRRPSMIRHLWDEHRLILDGRRVREPWAVIEDWISEYRTSGDAVLLEHCRLRGRQLDPDDGLHRVHRLLLQAGVNDSEARRDLIALARERHASLCPGCYALAPQPCGAPPRALNLRPGRLSAGDYVVETSTKGIWNQLEVRAPGRVLFDGREGWWFWTRRGATLFLAGPFVLFTLATAVWPEGGLELLVPVTVLAVAALLLQWLVRRWWRTEGAPPNRLLRHAWTRLAPRLHEPEFSATDSAFLAELALLTPAGAFRQHRGPLLTSLLKRTEDAVIAGLEPPAHLAALRRLAVEDAAARGADPVPLVADQLARCFEGRLPLVYAEDLLSGWRSDWWTRGNLNRLRVLLCERAFEAGFEVSNLLDAGKTAAALGEVLATDDPTGLAALRLLWSQRPTRPWDHCGGAQTVFDLAADSDHADLLSEHPDLLLRQREAAWVIAVEGGEEPMREAEILICVGGVWLQEVRFTESPAVVEETRKVFGGELALGKRRFRGPGEIDALARRMERWFRFAFKDFFPRMASVRTWQSPERAAILRAWGAAPCRECGRYFLPRVGAIGVALDEAAQ
jgi:uncharacterized C2H2 Zn-finger protein